MPLRFLLSEAKKSYGQISDFLFARLFLATVHYVNVVGLCEGHVVLFADQRDRSGSVSKKTNSGHEPTANSYEPKASTCYKFSDVDVSYDGPSLITKGSAQTKFYQPISPNDPDLYQPILMNFLQ